MGIRREEEMEMSDDDMEDSPESKDSDDSGIHHSWLTNYKQKINIFLKAVQAVLPHCVKEASVHHPHIDWIHW